MSLLFLFVLLLFFVVCFLVVVCVCVFVCVVFLCFVCFCVLSLFFVFVVVFICRLRRPGSLFGSGCSLCRRSCMPVHKQFSSNDTCIMARGAGDVVRAFFSWPGF